MFPYLPSFQTIVFTGWEDPPLAPDGVEDAKRAGRILRQHDFQFDVLYTSWLARAIQTGMYVLDELDCPWIPVIKSHRLNERMCTSKFECFAFLLPFDMLTFVIRSQMAH
jgi:bisphosphoglycerate-dependent phosphoglycerate mutase family 1